MSESLEAALETPRTHLSAPRISLGWVCLPAMSAMLDIGSAMPETPGPRIEDSR